MPTSKKSKELLTRLILGAIGLALVAWLVVQFRASSGTPAGVSPQIIEQGRNVYQQSCAACHDATNLQLATQPPKLDGLFQRPTLPSGAPATDAEVRSVILNGRGIMPPFEGVIPENDVSALLQFLHTK